MHEAQDGFRHARAGAPVHAIQPTTVGKLPHVRIEARGVQVVQIQVDAVKALGGECVVDLLPNRERRQLMLCQAACGERRPVIRSRVAGA